MNRRNDKEAFVIVLIITFCAFTALVFGSYVVSTSSKVNLSGNYEVYRSSSLSTEGIIPVGMICFFPLYSDMGELTITYLDKTASTYSYTLLNNGKLLRFNDSIYRIGHFQGYISIIPQFGEGEDYIYLKR
jgi:hypothetical protein